MRQGKLSGVMSRLLYAEYIVVNTALALRKHSDLNDNYHRGALNAERWVRYLSFGRDDRPNPSFEVVDLAPDRDPDMSSLYACLCLATGEIHYEVT